MIKIPVINHSVKYYLFVFKSERDICWDYYYLYIKCLVIKHVKKARLFLPVMHQMVTRSYWGECTVRVHPYDLAMARVQTTVQTQLTVCGGWKNAGQKEREIPTGWPAAFSHLSPHLSCTRPLFVKVMYVIWRRSYSQTLQPSRILPDQSREKERMIWRGE